MSHTPGPWEVFKAGTFWGVDAGRKSIVVWGNADEDTGVQGTTVEQAQANAHLISAAPDMLETLKTVRRIILTYPGSMIAMAIFQIDAAIKKAEGRQ